MSSGCPLVVNPALASFVRRFCPERLRIRVDDLEFDITPSVRLHGKGRRQRALPLWNETVMQIRHWLRFAGLQKDQAPQPNRWELS